jgi:hypothetical protein
MAKLSLEDSPGHILWTVNRRVISNELVMLVQGHGEGVTETSGERS